MYYNQNGDLKFERYAPCMIFSDLDFNHRNRATTKWYGLRASSAFIPCPRQLFTHYGPKIFDVLQTKFGNCAFLATLAATTTKENGKKLLCESMVDLLNGWVMVRLFHHVTKQPIYIKLQKTQLPNEPLQKALWVCLIEKAYAAYRLIYGYEDEQEVIIESFTITEQRSRAMHSEIKKYEKASELGGIVSMGHPSDILKLITPGTSTRYDLARVKSENSIKLKDAIWNLITTSHEKSDAAFVLMHAKIPHCYTLVGASQDEQKRKFIYVSESNQKEYAFFETAKMDRTRFKMSTASPEYNPNIKFIYYEVDFDYVLEMFSELILLEYDSPTKK